MAEKKKWIPWFFRRQESCPDCGFIVNRNPICFIKDSRGDMVSFTCCRCESHYSIQEYFELNADKYDRTADLSQEQFA